MKYMLLPFSHGIDAAAIEQAIALAHQHAATLVPLSIILLSRSRGSARLEHIAQSKDFLALVEWKAARAGIPIKKVECYACEEVPVIDNVAQKLQDAAVLLFVRQQKGVLLPTSAIDQMMRSGNYSCFLSLLPEHRSLLPVLRDGLHAAHDVMVGSLLHFTA
jgi:hypothetical protein